MKKQTTNIKVIVLMIGFALIGLMLISNISAYKLLCLSRGQSIPILTCKHDLCIICVTDDLHQANPRHCNDQGDGCSLLGGDTTVDSEAPILTVTSPINNNVYKSRQVSFDVSANEVFTLYWRDNTIATSNMWRRVAAGLTHYKLNLNFKEGLNDLTMKAMDRGGNIIEYPVKFYIDSKKPTIKKTLPAKGFSSGFFGVQFSEENPKSVVLNYGNDAVGIRTVPMDLGTCSIVKNVYTCNTTVNVNDYNNQNIRYWFTVKDIGNNSVLSKTLTLSVDTSTPVITNLDNMINVTKTKVYFNLSISEQNFKGAYYKITSDPRANWKTICTKLKDGLCVKKDTFSKKGNYEVEIKVVDQAGNENVQSASFSIV
ncbi:MAG: hypothetical protein WC979_08420 [Candidatus Pacearchaeota archaeon]|jgi:hypothetical protein